MRHAKILRQMAGIEPTPYEKRLNREQRQLNKYAADLYQRSQLIERALRRERGEHGTKPMPYQQIDEK